MRLILFRHGPAGHADPERWPNDRARPLSPRGRAKTRAAARGLACLLPADAHVISSPLVRARETAEALLRARKDARLKFASVLGKGAGSREILALLSDIDPAKTVVLVGHEPALGLLAGAFVAGVSGSLPLKKAGACEIVFEGRPRRGAGTVSWFASPRMLRALGKKGKKSG